MHSWYVLSYAVYDASLPTRRELAGEGRRGGQTSVSPGRHARPVRPSGSDVCRLPFQGEHPADDRGHPGLVVFVRVRVSIAILVCCHVFTALPRSP